MSPLTTSRLTPLAIGSEARVGDLRLTYVAHGALPARWAHSFQSFAMAAAFARQLPSFELLVPSGFLGAPAFPRRLTRWYDLSYAVRIRPIPVTFGAAAARLESPEGRHRYARRVVARARRSGCEIVWTRCLEVAEEARSADLPVVFETHAGRTSPHLRRLARLARDPGVRALVSPIASLGALHRSLGASEARAWVLPNAVDPARFPERDAQAARRALGLREAGAVVVYVGHLYRHKGPDVLLGMARRLRDVRFFAVGGWDEDVAQWRAHARDVPNLLFTGFVPHARIPLWLAAADALVLPHAGSGVASEETCPLKLFEYLAAGRPVVAAAIRALGEILPDETCVLQVPPDDPAAFADALRRVLEDAALAGRLTAAGRRFAAENTWERRAAEALRRLASTPLEPPGPARARG